MHRAWRGGAECRIDLGPGYRVYFGRDGEATGTQPKSLIRMFGPRGNPQARNLFGIIGYLQKQAGVELLDRIGLVAEALDQRSFAPGIEAHWHRAGRALRGAVDNVFNKDRRRRGAEMHQIRLQIHSGHDWAS